jgi:hypothetical protein
LSIVVALVIALAAGGCAQNAPPNLTPTAQTAFLDHRVQKGLDVIRDVAVDANNQIPPLVSTQTTRQIVRFHRLAIVTIHAGPGWKAQVTAGLNAALVGAGPNELFLLQPYLVLVSTLLNEVK